MKTYTATGILFNVFHEKKYKIIMKNSVHIHNVALSTYQNIVAKGSNGLAQILLPDVFCTTLFDLLQGRLGT